MSKLTTCLWFDTQAEAAAELYVGVFREAGLDASIDQVSRYGDTGPGPKGSVLTVAFTLDGHRVMGLNGGPHFTLSPAASLVIDTRDQAETDFFWDRLQRGGGEPSQCGWLTDRFGVSWQVVPLALREMMAGVPAGAERLMAALMKMTKLDIAELERAYAG